MSQFIVICTYSDGCTYTEEVPVAVECESQEQLYVELTDAIRTYVDAKNADSDYTDLKSFQKRVICGSNFDMEGLVYRTDYEIVDGKHKKLKHSKFEGVDPEIKFLCDWFEEQKTAISLDD